MLPYYPKLLQLSMMKVTHYTFMIGDTQELVSMSIYMAKNSIPLISNLTLNTLTVLLFNSSLIDLSKKIAKFNLKHYIIDKPQLYLISHLNLAKIQYF